MYYNDSIKKVPLDQNKYLNYTHFFIQDKKGNVWASTNKGLFMSPGQSLIDFWNKGPGNIKFRYFGKSEGIDELELNGGCSPCAIQMRSGIFSFPGIDGLIQFNPDSIPDFADHLEKTYNLPKEFLQGAKQGGTMDRLKWVDNLVKSTNAMANDRDIAKHTELSKIDTTELKTRQENQYPNL